MNLNTRGWDNLYVPDKVFVEKLQPLNYDYEYSGEKPATLYNLESILNGYYSTQNYLRLFYLLPEIFAPIHEIASRVSDAVWQLKSFSNDEVIYSNADFNRLFSQPNPLNTMRQLVYQAVCFEIVIGKNFFYKNNPTTLQQQLSSIVAWWNLPADRVIAEMQSSYDAYSANTISDFIKQYKITDVSGKPRIFDVKNVLPVVNFSLEKPHDINCAHSMLKGADKAIRNLIPVYEARGTIYLKRGALGMWVSEKTDASGKIALTPGEKKAFQADYEKNFGLGYGQSTTQITNQPVSWQKSSMSIEELQPFDETLSDAVAIYKVLRVPRHLVPSKDNSTFANADADMKSFYSDVIIPWAKRYADLWTTWLGVDNKVSYRQYIAADFSHIDILQENKKDKASVDQINGNVYLQRFTSGVGTLNDWIAASGSQISVLPIYTKRLFEMTPEELDQVKGIINIKAVSTGKPSSSVNATENPAIE
jgi:hypothetical protein